MSLLTPIGVNDFNPEENETITSLQETLNRVYRAHGFKEVKTPSIEYLDVLSPGFAGSLSKQAIKFFDDKGHALVLRPDHTTPIARLVAARMQKEELPLKLSYSSPIFRKQETENAQELEVLQSGIEYIGDGSPTADAQVLRILIESFLAIGAKTFTIDVGHASFLEAYDETQTESLLKGDYVTLGHIPKRGGREVVENNAHLLEVYEILAEKNLQQYVTFNQGLAKHLSYYTGLIFEGYIQGIRQVVASGGRYDDLINTFGYNVPAVGFAINVNALQKLETLQS